MGWGIPLLLALAVSIDGFSVGFSCGLRRLIIPLTSLMVISLLSAGAIALSMFTGSAFMYLASLRSITAVGGTVLILFGIVAIAQHYIDKGAKDDPAPGAGGEIGAKQPRRPERFTYLLRRPEAADLDRSGILSAGEALLLGSALAADAFAAGFGAALIGAPLWSTVLAVGLTKFVLVPLGVAFGRAAAGKVAPAYIPLLGGAILIFLGIMNLF